MQKKILECLMFKHFLTTFINIKHNLFKVKQNIKSILKYLIHCAWMYFSEDETFKSSKTD